ncbi:hypothetical protein AMECASPLE_039205 [Ameca splendens]|uniref:Uncharacterized protein n=1 Tax=Ameca splendens TaxID=208324 RepID=A0ABV0ZUH7_9TELE
MKTRILVCGWATTDHRILRRIDSSDMRSDQLDKSEELGTTLKPSCDAQTQWSCPGMEDHSYSQGPTISCVMSAPSPALPNSVSESVLQTDEDSLLYTGIPLIEFLTLVSCLQSFC